jgi:RepB plasmid partitioning protein
MIARAVSHGVSRERIASVLGVDVTTVNRKATLLDGLCPEAISLLADNIARINHLLH